MRPLTTRIDGLGYKVTLAQDIMTQGASIVGVKKERPRIVREVICFAEFNYFIIAHGISEPSNYKILAHGQAAWLSLLLNV